MTFGMSASATTGLCLALLALAFPAAAQPEAIASPSHWYRFTGNLADEMGGPAGSLSGVAVFVNDGACGQALATGPGLELNLGPQVGNFGAGDFTLVTWVRIPPENLARQACSKRGSCAETGSYFDLRFTENNVVLEMRGGGQSAAVGTSAFLYNNLWRSVVITRAGGLVSLFLDGNGQASINQPPVPVINADPFRLGGGPCMSAGLAGLAGALDEVQIYDFALSPIQVFQLHQRRALALVSQPAAVGSCAGGSAEFFVQSAAGVQAGFRWQAESPPASNLWINLTHGGPGLGSQTLVSVTTGAGGSASTLRLAPLDPADATRYRCVITHSCGSVTSLAAALTLTNCCPADFNGDSFVDPDDLSDFITCFFLNVQSPGVCQAADVNGDGFVDPDDLSDFITAFFTSAC